MIVVSLAFFPQSFEVIDLWFQKSIQSKYTIVAKAVAVLLGAAARFWLVAVNASLMAFGAMTILDAVLNAIALVFIFHRRGQTIRTWRFCKPEALVLFQDSWPLILSGILVAVYTRVEQVLVMNKLGEHNAGIYYAAVRITDLWGFIPGLILPSVYPLLVQARESNRERYVQRLQIVFDLLTGLGYAAAIVVSLASPLLIGAIYGSRYQQAAAILAVRAWITPITFSGSVRAQYFLMERTTIYHTWSALVGIGCNIGLALALMPHFMALGAAISVLISYAISAYLTSAIFARLRECLVLQTKAFLLPFRLAAFIRSLRQLR
jgi:PST family polysaccharide transporter